MKGKLSSFVKIKFQTKIQFESTTFKIVLLVRSGVNNLKLLVRYKVPALGFFIHILYVLFGVVQQTELWFRQNSNTLLLLVTTRKGYGIG